MAQKTYVKFLRDNGKERPDAPADEAHWCETMRGAADELEKLRTAMKDACDLLAERTHGNPARSAGHNARLRLEAALN